MTLRPRVCGAIVQGDTILMVHQSDGDRSFWTLPGGGVEPGESLEEAVLREVMEEVRLSGKVVKLLFEDAYAYGPVHCFLVEAEAAGEAELGSDPELPPDEQVLMELRWFPLEAMKDDVQVSQVIRALSG